MSVLNLKRPHVLIGRERNPDWIEQDGRLFAWSESNSRYELAWWLRNVEETELVRRLRVERPAPASSEPRFSVSAYERQ